jgi:hypothetical protein
MRRYRWGRINVGKKRTLKKRVRKQLQRYHKEVKADAGAHDRWSWEAAILLGTSFLGY